MSKEPVILNRLKFWLLLLLTGVSTVSRAQEELDLLMPVMPKQVPSQTLERTGYVASYNKATLCPNWVAWHLTAEHADGMLPRDNAFYEDMDVPAPRATNED